MRSVEERSDRLAGIDDRAREDDDCVVLEAKEEVQRPRRRDELFVRPVATGMAPPAARIKGVSFSFV